MGGVRSWLGLSAVTMATALFGTWFAWTAQDAPGGEVLGPEAGAGWRWITRLLLLLAAAALMVAAVRRSDDDADDHAAVAERVGLLCGALCLPVGALSAWQAVDGTSFAAAPGFVLWLGCTLAGLTFAAAGHGIHR